MSRAPWLPSGDIVVAAGLLDERVVSRRGRRETHGQPPTVDLGEAQGHLGAHAEVVHHQESNAVALIIRERGELSAPLTRARFSSRPGSPREMRQCSDVTSSWRCDQLTEAEGELDPFEDLAGLVVDTQDATLGGQPHPSAIGGGDEAPDRLGKG